MILISIEMLTAQMEILKVLLKDGDFLCLDDITVKIKELLTPERKMINEVITVCKLIPVNPATSAAGKRSFSTARRLKTRLRSTMTQERFSNLTVLTLIEKEQTDFLFVTLQTNLQIATVTQSEILVSLKHLMYSEYQPLLSPFCYMYFL